MPTFGENSLFLELDLMGALQPAILPVVFALVMTAVFDATGTIRAVAGQANLLDKEGQIINGGKALTSDSVSSIFLVFSVLRRLRYILNRQQEQPQAVKRA